MNWYIKCLRQYFDFKGRARRKEYWMFTLFNFIFVAIIEIIEIMIMLSTNSYNGSFLLVLYYLLTMIPSLAVGVRRLHDIGESGWMLLVGFIPLAGAIWLIVLFCKDSQPGSNLWGDNPKEIAVQ